MGESPSRKFGLLQDLILIAVAVSISDLFHAFVAASLWLTAHPLQNISIYYLARQIISHLPLSNDPEKEQHEQAQIRAAANLRRLDRRKDDSESESNGEAAVGNHKSKGTRKEDLVLNQYESQIAMEVVAPEDIPVGFEGQIYKTLA